MAYNALLNPLMDLSGLISTQALNADAQTALALSVTTAATVDILVVDALQASAGAYTGLASTDLHIQGNATVDGILNSGHLNCTDIVASGTIKANTTNSKAHSFANANNSFSVLPSGATICGSLASQLIIQGSDGVATLYNTTIAGTLKDSTGSVGTAGQILSSSGIDIAWIDDVDVSVVRPVYDYWVSPNGSDSASGNVSAPFLTIQNAINACETFTDNLPRTVNIMCGQYSENLLISKSRISFVGQGANSNLSSECTLSGTISIAVLTGLSDIIQLIQQCL